MSLSFVNISPGIMLVGVVGYVGYGTFVQNGEVSWKVPTVMSSFFWGFSIYTIAEEGLIYVWDNHNHNFWGNQVWFDLLYSVAKFWFALLPRAKKLGMPVLPWCAYICSTTSIGGLHFYTRILYLEEKQQVGEAKEVGGEVAP
jgi:hypothetical protein